MKLKNILLGLVIIFCTGSLHAQNATKSVVYLKNGSIIKCDIMEWQNDTIKFKTSDGSLFVYSMKEVEKISNTNTLSEKNDASDFQDVKTVSGNMEKSGRSLILDGNKIKDDEIRKLLNVDTYQTYKSAFSQVGTGNFFLYTGFITAAAGLFIRFAHKEKEAYIIWGISGIFIPIGIVLHSIGSKRIDWVVEQFNNGIRAENSISVSPSLLQFNDIANGQNSYALGATLSINF